jgi:hypothetical protein
MKSMIEKFGITPGPWEWHIHEYWDSLQHNCKVVLDDGSAGGEYNPSIVHDEPNAKLIAAAPDLLEVLIEVMARAEYWSEYYVPVGIHDRIKNAVEKATGRTAEEVKEIYNARD